VAIGINPSTATDTLDDHTIRKIKGFAIKNNFNGWLMLNLYPQRSTNPNGLDQIINKETHKENIFVILSVLKSLFDYSIIACWGNSIEIRPYLRNCLHDLSSIFKELNKPLFSFGPLTQCGNPRHPARLPYSVQLLHFDVDKYLSNWNN